MYFRDRTLERFGHFFEDGLGGFGGVGSVDDGTADDQVAGALAQGFSGGSDTLLVAGVSAGGADAGNDQDALGTGKGAQGSDLVWGADEASNSRSQAHAGQQLHLAGWGTLDANGAQLGRVHAGKHGDGQQLRGIGEAVQSGAGGGQHGRTSGGMDGRHAHTQRRGRAHRSGDDVGNVVEFQVKEDGVAALEQRLQDGGTGGHEELQSHLEPAAGVLQPGNKGAGRGRVRYIEGHDKAAARLCHRVWAAGRRRLGGNEGGVQPFRDGHN